MVVGDTTTHSIFDSKEPIIDDDEDDLTASLTTNGDAPKDKEPPPK